MFRERERLGAHHVANDAFNFLEVSENDMQQEQYENIRNSLEICVLFDMIHEIFAKIKNCHFQRPAWHLLVLERFSIFVIYNVTPTH